MQRWKGVVVIGGGTAGMTAAMYAARAGCTTRVYEGDPFDSNDLPGGQLMFAHRVEFVPGFPEGIEGPLLMAKLREQAERLGVELVSSRVERISMTGAGLVLGTEHGELEAASVVLATGARPRFLGVGEERLLGLGVSVCAMCDAPLYRDRDVAVVGGGDTAVDEALLLSAHARRVTVLHRGPDIDAHPLLRAALRTRPNVDVLLGAEIVEVLDNGMLAAVRYRDSEGGETDLPVSGLFLAAGRVPNSEVVHAIAMVDENGYVVTDAAGRTSVAGLFACGECADPDFRQFATAVGSGCRAGMSAAAFAGHPAGGQT